jgi:arylformamidase
LGDAAVYGALTQHELDREYNAVGTVPSTDPYFARYAAESERVRAALAHEADVRYAPGERCVLDIFRARAPGAPLFLFAHGGYWRRLDKSYFSFVAEPVVAAGGAAAVISYPLAPQATLDEIVAAARAATRWCAHNAARANAAPNRIVVGGHSAGGQLAGMIATTDSVAGIFSLSGIFDLEPLRLSNINEWMRLDAAAAARNSPTLHLPRARVPLVAAVGALESAEFRRQSRLYVDAFEAGDYPATYLETAEDNHFSIPLSLADPKTELGGLLLRMLGL